MDPNKKIDIEALKAQIDAEIEARMAAEADSARFIQRRGFRVGSLRLLVEMQASSEVLGMLPLCRLPGAPAGVSGLANRHGRVVPVIDLRLFFGEKSERPLGSWLLVCGLGDEAVGIDIDNLPERKSFMQKDVTSLAGLSHPIATYARAAYREGQDIWIDLDTEKLFAAIFQVDLASA